DLDELAVVQFVADRLVDVRAQAHRGRGGRTTKVEVTVLETRLLADRVGLGQSAGDLERKRRRLVQYHDIGCDELDLPGGQVRVLVAGRAAGDLTGHLEDELAAQRVGDLLIADDD